MSIQDTLDELGFSADPECAGTAARWRSVLAEFAPKGPPPPMELLHTSSHEPVLLRDLPFHSLCVHHLLPFFGTADLAILPSGRIAGLGAMVRVLEHFARQPQLQERLGAQVAQALGEGLGAAVLVRLRARQMCMEMRGVARAGTVETWSSHGEVGPLLSLLRGA